MIEITKLYTVSIHLLYALAAPKFLILRNKLSGKFKKLVDVQYMYQYSKKGRDKSGDTFSKLLLSL
jgi:hypothetical protein